MEKASWILGGGWNNDLWGGDMPVASWIDDITPDNPVGNRILNTNGLVRCSGYIFHSCLGLVVKSGRSYGFGEFIGPKRGWNY